MCILVLEACPLRGGHETWHAHGTDDKSNMADLHRCVCKFNLQQSPGKMKKATISTPLLAVNLRGKPKTYEFPSPTLTEGDVNIIHSKTSESNKKRT